ncbi:hypothetical protein FYK55_02995 [Roseiconus nitratireducens]|uniref:Uncharacterized protein n=1 Tax=Roseiconus nitratireducens TaxID=2605748 RepID=A0A5M6DHP0_9BACT|nr:hypothetical protein [Roseiconus nitratireducens]KAA5545896.1 hypothetical protein FYK55_02995 [Roseiconus nitratireducens]
MNSNDRSFRRTTVGFRWTVPLLAMFFLFTTGVDFVCGQVIYSRRSVVAVPAGIPVLPPPSATDPWLMPPMWGSPALAPRSRGLRIRAPFFSLSIGASIPRYDWPDYPDYGYGYPYDGYRSSLRYRGLSDDRYGSPWYGDRYRSAPPNAIVRSYRPSISDPPITGQYFGPSYSPGENGGIPELTDPLPTEYAEIDPFSSPATLRESAELLLRSLQRQGEQGQIWMDFLDPMAVINAVDAGQSLDQLNDLLGRYNGVKRNAELRHIARLPGFESTRLRLSELVQETPVPSGPIPSTEALEWELPVEPSDESQPSAETPAVEPESELQEGVEILPSPAAEPETI